MSPVWGVWCPDEQSQVAQDLAAEADGTAAAEQHNLATGHAAVATLSLPDAVAASTDIQLFPFPFCILYNGRPWRSMTLMAPGVDEAVTTATQIVDLLNQTATRKGFPALFSATDGICPAF